MGTSGAWGGSGSDAAKALRDKIANGGGDAGAGRIPGSPPTIDAADLRDAVRLLDGRTSTRATARTSGSRVAATSARRSSRMGGGGSGAGGARRSSARSARAAGSTIAAAIAYNRGDRTTLTRLGLDFDALAALNDPFEVIRRIVDMACGQAESTIEDHERRLMAADVAEHLIVGSAQPEDISAQAIVVFTVSAMLSEIILSECGDVAAFSSGAVSEEDVRYAAEQIAGRATFAEDGVTATDFTAAIQTGLDQLREILGIE